MLAIGRPQTLNFNESAIVIVGVTPMRLLLNASRTHVDVYLCRW